MAIDNQPLPANHNKRKPDLADQIPSMPQRSKKARAIPEGFSQERYDQQKYELVGRKIACLGNPFGSAMISISVGLKIDAGKEDQIEMDEVEVYRKQKFYEAILEHAPGLVEEVNTGTIEGKEFTKICGWIATGMSEQRSTDLGSVKHTGLTYLFPNFEALNPPTDNGANKSDRGFNHPQIARLLCPRKKLQTFEEDPDLMMDALQSGKINCSAGNWPTCFYRDDIVYDRNNKLNGLFCSETAFRFYKHLFIGPSAAKTDAIVSNTSKQSKNRAWALTEVTPQIIAYVHAILYFTLSTAPRWEANIGQMNLEDLTWGIVEMFENRDDWTRATLKWWNSRAFAKVTRPIRNDSDSEDDMTQIRAQRGGHQKSIPLSIVEHHAVEGHESATPPPNEHDVEQVSVLNNIANDPIESELSDCLTDDNTEKPVAAIPTVPKLAVSIEPTGGILDPALATTSSTLSATIAGQVAAPIESPDEPLPSTGKGKRKARASGSTAVKKTRRGKVSNGI